MYHYYTNNKHLSVTRDITAVGKLDVAVSIVARAVGRCTCLLDANWKKITMNEIPDYSQTEFDYRTVSIDHNTHKAIHLYAYLMKSKYITRRRSRLHGGKKHYNLFIITESIELLSSYLT